jgi:hypothetical protein
MPAAAVGARAIAAAASATPPATVFEVCTGPTIKC